MIHLSDKKSNFPPPKIPVSWGECALRALPHNCVHMNSSPP